MVYGAPAVGRVAVTVGRGVGVTLAMGGDAVGVGVAER